MPRGRRIDDFIASPASRGGGPPRRESGGEGEARCSHADVVKAAELAAEKVLAGIASRLFEEVDKLREEVRSLAAEVERLRKALEAARQGRSQGQRRGRGRLEEVLAKEGYVLGSEARAKLGYGPSRLHSEALEADAVILELDGDIAVVNKKAFEEFTAALAAVKTPDPEEAARQLGRYSRLFTALRKGGSVYYDARRGHWRLLT